MRETEGLEAKSGILRFLRFGPYGFAPTLDTISPMSEILRDGNGTKCPSGRLAQTRLLVNSAGEAEQLVFRLRAGLISPHTCKRKRLRRTNDRFAS